MREMDINKAVRESVRWYILVALNAGRPFPVGEDILVRTLIDAKLRMTTGELRRELDYLADKGLVEVGQNRDDWEASLTALGVDVVEYTVDAPPGMSRPAKR